MDAHKQIVIFLVSITVIILTVSLIHEVIRVSDERKYDRITSLRNSVDNYSKRLTKVTDLVNKYSIIITSIDISQYDDDPKIMNYISNLITRYVQIYESTNIVKSKLERVDESLKNIKFKKSKTTISLSLDTVSELIANTEIELDSILSDSRDLMEILKSNRVE